MPNYVFSGTLLISLKDVIYLQLNTAKDHKELYINLINRVPNRVLQYAATKQESVGSRLIEIPRRDGDREKESESIQVSCGYSLSSSLGKLFQLNTISISSRTLHARPQ